MLSLRLEVHASCLGTQSCKIITQKYFDDSLSSGFSERPEQLIDAVNETGALVSQVIPSQSTKSHYFFDVHAWRDLFGRCVSVIVHTNYFLSDKMFILLKCANTQVGSSVSGIMFRYGAVVA